MARILIGNIKGPKGDTGPQGKQGPTGPQGPKGDTGPMPALINNAATTSAGVGALDAAMGKTLSDQIAVLNSELINGSGLGLTEGMYSIYAPNTADDMVYPGLYRCNGITIGNMPDFYGYAIVMSSLDHTIIKQLFYHNASGSSRLRYRFNNQWTDAGEFALKDDLPVFTSITIDPEGNDYVDIPISGITTSWAPIVLNADTRYWTGYVKGCVVTSETIHVLLSEQRSGSIRLNIAYMKPSN